MSDADPLLSPVYAGRDYKPFGEFTLADVRARADELRAATGFGPTARIASMARTWSELANAMSKAGARTVAELPQEAARDFARRTWAQPPSLL